MGRTYCFGSNRDTPDGEGRRQWVGRLIGTSVISFRTTLGALLYLVHHCHCSSLHFRESFRLLARGRGLRPASIPLLTSGQVKNFEIFSKQSFDIVVAS